MEKRPMELSIGGPNQLQLRVRSCTMDSVRRLARCLLLLLLIPSVPLLNGCAPKNLGIGTSQMLAVPLPQHFDVSAAADKVFAIVTSEAERAKQCRVLARSAKDRLISWCDRVENWHDLGLDTVGYNPKRAADGVDPDVFRKMAEDTGKGVAIITVWVEDLGPKSRVHVRRVTYGDQSFAGMGHSRGEFERELGESIARKL